MTTSTTGNQPIVFILDNVSGFEAMAEGLYAGYEVHVLSADGDALAQMASYLEGRTGIEAIHLVSHGEAGQLDLGTVALTTSNMGAYSNSLDIIRASLSQDADFLIYGCDVAQGTVGEAFVEALAQATGADVAASSDVTGPAGVGGDAVLEVSTGTIEAASLAADNFQTSLGADVSLPAGLASAPYTFDGSNFQIRVDATISATDSLNAFASDRNVDQYALSNIADGTVVSVYMGNSSTIDDFLQIVRNGALAFVADDSGSGERGYDGFLSWTYQAGDIVQASTYEPGESGSYSLFFGTDTGAVPIATIQGGFSQITSGSPVFSAVEDGSSTGLASSTGSLSGTLTIANPGSLDLSGLTFSVTGPSSSDDGGNVIVAGQFGTLYLNPLSGEYTYAPSVIAVDALRDGETGLDTFTFNAVGVTGDITSGSFSFSATGISDAPIISVDGQFAALNEAGGANNSDAGVQMAQMGMLARDAEGGTAFDTATMGGEGWVLSGDSLSMTRAGAYGEASLELSSGVVTYVLANESEATQALGGSEQVFEDFDVVVLDTDNLSVRATASFVINGTDDRAVLQVSEIAMAATYIDGNGQEQTNHNHTGFLSLTDVDNSVASYGTIDYGITGGFVDDGGTSIYIGGFGALFVNSSSGQFDYVANLQTHSSIGFGEIAYDVFTVNMSNGAELSESSAFEVQIVGMPSVLGEV